MKKIILLTLTFISSSTYGMNLVTVDTEGLGKAIEPLVQEAVKEASGLLKGALGSISKKKVCKASCGTLQAGVCAPLIKDDKENDKKGGKLAKASLKRAKFTVNMCKQECQEKIKVGAGYTLKIRYAETADGHPDWNMQDCIRTATEAGAHEVRPELNKYSIAIYGKADYETAIEHIAHLEAYDKFIRKAGHTPETKGKSSEEIKKLVEEAKSKREESDKEFQKEVHELKRFGPQ